MRRVLFPVFLVVFLPFFPQTASSELIHGTARLYLDADLGCDQAIDFSTQTLVGCHTAEADFTYYSSLQHPEQLEFGVYYPGGWMVTVDTPFEDVSIASLIGSIDQRVMLNRTYIIRTKDPLYAKLVVRSINEGLTVDVEYVVQTDGTRVLGPALPVEQTTWGKIKALYR
jgi:hypothetical protein